MVEHTLNPITNQEDLELIGGYLEQFKKDTQFLESKKADWRVEYPDKWIVVFQEKLAGVGNTIQDALDDAQIHDAPVARVAIEYLSSKPLKMILHGGKC